MSLILKIILPTTFFGQIYDILFKLFVLIKIVSHLVLHIYLNEAAWHSGSSRHHP